MELFSWNVDFKQVMTPLCELSLLYDDTGAVSPQRVFTPFYHALFRHVRGASICLGMIGIGVNDVVLPWSDYLCSAQIIGFDSDDDVLARCALRASAHSAARGESACRVATYPLDVARQSPCGISGVLKTALYAEFTRRGNYGALAFDALIQSAGADVADNSTDAQLRLLPGAAALLAPGGMLVVEGIDPDVDEAVFAYALVPMIGAGVVQDAYFVTSQTARAARRKLLVIVKAGGPVMFCNRKPVTMITPSCRPGNLVTVSASLPWDLVSKWYVVYDGLRVPTNPRQFTANPKVVEVVFAHKASVAGNAQRNCALDLITAAGAVDTFLYFLDDDNLVHPALIRLLRSFACEGMLYSFNQRGRIRGAHLRRLEIDTAMTLLDASVVGHVRWKISPLIADGLYMEECAAICKKDWIYIDNDLCSYNVLPK